MCDNKQSILFMIIVINILDNELVRGVKQVEMGNIVLKYFQI